MSVSVDQQVGCLVDLLTCEGRQLERALKHAESVSGDDANQRLCEERLVYFFYRHAVVLQGHLPDFTGPQERRVLESHVPGLLCTCESFIMHAECEHVLFVRGLTEDLIAMQFKSIPAQRRRGRKRKNDGVAAVAAKKAAARKL